MQSVMQTLGASSVSSNSGHWRFAEADSTTMRENVWRSWSNGNMNSHLLSVLLSRSLGL